MSRPLNTAVLDHLVREGVLDTQQRESLLWHAQQSETPVEDALIESKVVSEQDLLRTLARLYRTRFVTTAKLAKAQVPRQTLALVPRKLAEQLGVFPILHKPESHTLAIVAANLLGEDVAKQVKFASKVRQVEVYIARPAAVEAAIRKHYHKEQYAFSLIGGEGSAAGPAHSLGGIGGAPNLGVSFGGLAPFGAVPSVPNPPAPPAVPSEGPQRPVLRLDAPNISFDLPSSTQAQATSKEDISTEAYLETLNVLVTLVEHGRGELRGHSSQVARFARRVCDRVGLQEEQTRDILVAAYLHDIGKASHFHLTALNVAQYEGHHIQAQKVYLTPLRVFDTAQLSETAVASLTHMYERWDGRGFPDRLDEKNIPLGARVLAIVETYADLTAHSKNPFRRKLSPQEACEALAPQSGKVFDPNLLDLFRMLVLGEDMRTKLFAERKTVLLVDPDPEETTVLEMRLIERGYDVLIARDGAHGLDLIKERDPDLLITEAELSPTDGFDLVDKVRKSGKQGLPVLFLTRLGDRGSVTRGFDLGAADYLVKPASPELVAAKTSQVLDKQTQGQGSRGVRGSLREMSLPDVIQILSNGRKSGQLKIHAQGQSGALYFSEGFIHDASFGSHQGEEAVYAMLMLADGDFSLDPSAAPSKRSIEMATESLLLEGMRRLDESQR